MPPIYNPFSKDFDDISGDDLSILTTVAEGWYVEYKREITNASSIAKSLTAMANTHGGWVLYGVAEKNKEEGVAGSFPGIPNADLDASLQRIRQAVANQANPSPYFLVKAIPGPVEAIGLEDGRSVIVCNVPWGPEAPYVHKDGRIYRRVGNGSEPVPETDRYMLEKLWARSEKIIDETDEWVTRDLEISKDEEDAAYVRIFLVSDFWGTREPVNHMRLSRFREIMTKADEHASIPFDNVYRAPTGFIARQNAGNDPEMLGLTWRYHYVGDSEIIVPLAKARKNSLRQMGDWLEGYDHVPRFLKLCYEQGYKTPTVIDLNLLFHVLIGLGRHQAAIATEIGWKDSIRAKVELSGIWRTIPFFDAAHVLDEYERHGIPLSMRDKLRIHLGKSEDSFLELRAMVPEEDEQRYAISIAESLFIIIATSLGVSLGDNSDDDYPNLTGTIGHFLDAGNRSLTVQNNRGRNSR